MEHLLPAAALLSIYLSQQQKEYESAAIPEQSAPMK